MQGGYLQAHSMTISWQQRNQRQDGHPKTKVLLFTKWNQRQDGYLPGSEDEMQGNQKKITRDHSGNEMRSTVQGLEAQGFGIEKGSA